ncbi:hypothetical protein SKAU_G00149540 [Synaphobranchus kaupii]|uniref:Uncharacterized protein n=1 Tax=Synaphobranchus kaupii TaxID=118154 RepID=A0A9Q1J536_SYNKA|nr:hypothetical protein SKAU_G00149540 [Synaphobranchus kaupii]
MLRGCTLVRHRNVAVRECAACHLEALVDSMGTARLLCCKKDIMSNFLSAVSRLPQDSSQEVRWAARIFTRLFVCSSTLVRAPYSSQH